MALPHWKLGGALWCVLQGCWHRWWEGSRAATYADMCAAVERQFVPGCRRRQQQPHWGRGVMDGVTHDGAVSAAMHDAVVKRYLDAMGYARHGGMPIPEEQRKQARESPGGTPKLNLCSRLAICPQGIRDGGSFRASPVRQRPAHGMARGVAQVRYESIR